MNYKTRIAITIAIFCFSIFWCGLASATEGQQCPQDPVNMFIAYGADILCGIDQQGISDLFRFNGSAGERITIEVLGTSRECIELVGITTACANSSQNWIDTVLPTTQQYTIRVYDGNNSTDTYSLFLERTVPYNPDASEETYGQDLSGQFDLKGDLDEFFFTASANDLIDILALSTNGGRPCMTLYAPDAKTTWNACANSGSNDIRQTLPLAGNYTIFLYDGNNAASNYRVTLECLTGPCVVVQVPDLSGYLTLRGAPLKNQLVGIVSPAPGGDQTTTTDQNGYYQFLMVPNGTFTVYAPITGEANAASAASVQASPDR